MKYLLVFLIIFSSSGVYANNKFIGVKGCVLEFKKVDYYNYESYINLKEASGVFVRRGKVKIITIADFNFSIEVKEKDIKKIIKSFIECNAKEVSE